MKVVHNFDVESTNFNKIKYGGYGYRELVSKLRPFVTDKDGKLIEGDVLKIAHEETYPRDKFFSIIKTLHPSLSSVDINKIIDGLIYS